MPSTHKKPKPWDTDDIDKWAIPPFKPEDNLGGVFAEESTFSTLFPKYREAYLKEAWPVVTKALERRGIACTLDLIEGSMTVRTTRKTYDPAAILDARDLIRLLARSVPAPQALKILEDGVACDIIKIRNLVRNKQRFVTRRQRLLGPGGTTLKALQMLTGCYMLVHGNTVSAMGPYKGLKEVRRVVEDCMANIHPIYHVRDLMVRRELAKDPQMAKESWDRYLPNFRRKNLSRRFVPHKVTDKSKKVYTPFPPLPEKSKVDLQIESGEYFLNKQAKQRAAEEERENRQRAKMAEKMRERRKDFVPPEEPTAAASSKKKKESVVPEEPTATAASKKRKESDASEEPAATAGSKKRKKSATPDEPTATAGSKKGKESVAPDEPSAVAESKKRKKSATPDEPTATAESKKAKKKSKAVES